jgi:hypothetical protein
MWLLSDEKEPLPKGKQWKTIIILSILNFALSNGLSTWGVKYISSGLGAIINPIWLVFTFWEKLAIAIAGLIIAFLGMRHFYEHK